MGRPYYLKVLRTIEEYIEMDGWDPEEITEEALRQPGIISVLEIQGDPFPEQVDDWNH